MPGIIDATKVQKAIWDNFHNKQIVNTCLLASSDVAIFEYQGKQFISVTIPRAKRTQRPVYLGANPLTGTYRRRGEGDYKCDESSVKRMLADASTEPRDAAIIRNFNLDDLDRDSLSAYRNDLRSTNPNHPFLVQDDIEFLRLLGAWKVDRETGESGPTVAGLLMFGKLRSILEELPHYHLDYQERERGSSRFPWTDRVTTDFTWSGNLYDFFRKVYPKLVSDLKVPFKLSPDSLSQRLDETEIHVALREALVNTLIHADYGGTQGILIHKRPDLFGFLNPGGLRLPQDIILTGGQSDCRNPALQIMFQLVGKAEKSGSGIPKILLGWKLYHKALPLLRERVESGIDKTILTLPLESLLSEKAVAELNERFPDQVTELTSVELIAMVTALNEGRVTNERLRSITSEHRTDITQSLRGLVDRGLLEQVGQSRGTWYHVAGIEPREENGDESPFTPSLPFSVESVSHSNTQADPVNTQGVFVNTQADPVNTQDSDVYSEEVIRIASEINSCGRVAPSKLDDAIISLCAGRTFSCKELASLLNRKQQTLLRNHLSRLIQEGRLRYTIPGSRVHPNQSYQSIEQSD